MDLVNLENFDFTPYLYVLIGIAAVIVALLLVALVRTLMIKTPPKGKPMKVDPVHAEVCAAKLAELVRIPSVSRLAGEDMTEFVRLQEKMAELFPLIHEKLEKTDLEGTLIYRWAGKNADKQPILLMAHQDVVPAPDEGWDVPPFSGEIIDGKVYGRGALDCKGTMLVVLQGVEELLREGFTPEMDVYLEFSTDEEISGTGAQRAAQWFAERNIRFAFVLDEGGAVVSEAVPGLDRPFCVIGVMEKGYMDVKVVSRGMGGHSSTPPRQGSVARLFVFAHHVEQGRPFNKQLSSEVKEMFAAMAPSFSFGMRYLLSNLWLFGPVLKIAMPKISPFGEALMATTFSFTQMHGSDAPNVIPKEPYLVCNLRPAPHQDCESSLAVLKKYAFCYDVDLEVMTARDASPVCDTSSREYAYIAATAAKCFPDAGVAPYVIMGGTDCRHFQSLSDNALRFSPIRMSPQQNASCHAANENVDISSLSEGVAFMKMLIKEWK